ncbi:MAG: HAD-IA family hydrolase [Pseudomonadota bacterium]
MSDELQAVIWDFGGVFTTSPFDAFAAYEVERGLPKDFIRSINAVNKDTNAWAQLERNEVTPAEFSDLFRGEAIAHGHDVPGRDVLGLLAGALRPAIVEALKVCKSNVKVGCITNNAKVGKGASMATDDEGAAAVADIMTLFDHVIESSKIGLRKPDPRIYALMCEALDVDPKHCIYIDDLGINLKPARQMGMTTIKALNETQILADLAEVTGYRLG